MESKGKFADYLAEAIGKDNAGIALEALSLPASVSVRMNPAKLDAPTPESVSEFFSMPVKPVLWNRYGWFLSERPVFTLDPLMHCGCYYVQDSSAMFVGEVFRQVLKKMSEEGALPKERPLRVLDLCAAPGGKTTDILSSLKMSGIGSYLLVSNEIMKQRAAVLSDNAGIWGDPDVVVTSVDPKAFASLGGWFDIIVADVPCSGEGMFRKDEEALAQWSEANVELCSARQRRILADVWPALSENGYLIYSTCTFNKYENDGNVSWTAEELGAEVVNVGSEYKGLIRTEHGVSLVPGFVEGEGQYCSVLMKTSSAPSHVSSAQKADKKQVVPADAAKKIKSWFNVPVTLTLRGDMIVAVPEHLNSEVRSLEGLRPLLRGVAVGQLKGKDIVPDADLALSSILERGAFVEAELTKEQALAFLHKDSLTLTGVEYKGLIRTEHGVSLVPGFVEGEGQYCSVLMKTSSAPSHVSSAQKADKKQVVPADAAKKIKSWFNVPVTLTLRGDMIVAVPEHLNSEVRSLEGLRPLLRGVAVGQLKGKDIVPDADLALSSILERGAFVEAELTKEQALAFLHKDSLTLTGVEKGIVLVTYLGHPLGFVKNLGNRCNNLHPQGRRIRMNI